MHSPSAIPVPIPHPALAASDWADCYQVSIPLSDMTASEAAELIFASAPAWTGTLMRLRNRIVAPLGLRTTEDIPRRSTDIGGFPLIEATPREIVMGFDDNHLDFRIIVTVTPAASALVVDTTTVIHRHNFLGYLYLGIVQPFHKRIVKVMLARFAQSVGSTT